MIETVDSICRTQLRCARLDPHEPQIHLPEGGKGGVKGRRSSMELTSTAIKAGEQINRRFTCDGANVSPPLSLSDPPSGTRSFALVCSDPDAPSGTWYHWAIFDLPAEIRALEEGYTTSKVRQGVNDFGK
ncbi:MAG: YbhB/YbcL family Raf kinase inhibitor-like protein, partial [Rhodospirillales bacterium]|nr:YbhB/YbcL family Raf kinase inhibitor-like protein [Rhodospirillales bacterium]